MSTLPADYWDTLPLGYGVKPLNRDANGLAAFDKPSGILSHPNMRTEESRALLICRYDLEHQCFIWETESGETRRLWLLNRLDSGTSGVILTASSAELAATVREHFARKQVRKVYHALVFGKPSTSMQIWRDLLTVKKSGGQVRTSATSGSITAITQFVFMQHAQRNFSTSLLRLEPQTGRSHQLRVQCAKRGLPIIGDQTYGEFRMNREFAKQTGEKRMFLHSVETAFNYDFGGKEHIFKAVSPLPPEFKQAY